MLPGRPRLRQTLEGRPRSGHGPGRQL